MKTICASCGVESEAAAGDCPKCNGAVLLAGRYRLLDVLGRGANGITYRAERTTDGEVFAVKEMPLRTLQSAKVMELFEREARVLRELDHAAIPRYEEDFLFGEGKSAALYLVQELVSGRTLEAEMASRRYDVAEVFTIVGELADVLEYLHRRSPPVVHRDVKPKNVMRRDDGRLALIDFGSVRDALGTHGGSTVAGTFGYMAPEQLAGKATPASDVYALGALAIALLTRKEPDALLGDDHRIHVREHVDAPEEVLDLLERMVEPNASKRIQRAREVKERANALASAASTASSMPPRPAASRTSKPVAERTITERDPEPAPPKGQRSRRRREPGPSDQAVRTRVLVAVFVLIPLAFVGWRAFQSKAAVKKLAATEVGIPELYARPVVTDVNGDGVEDVVLVTAIDRGPEARDDGEDAWGKEHGRFETFVQAIDGKDGRVLYSIDQGRPYSSAGNDAKSSPRIVLVAGKDHLGVARIPASGKASLTIHDLGSGKELKKRSFEQPLTGRACENRGGPSSPKGTFFFEQPGSTAGTVVDLERATVRAPAPSSCGEVSTANVADVPEEPITDRTQWSPRFTPETMLRKGAGPYGGRTIQVVSSGLGFLVVDENAAEPPPTGPAISIDDGGASPRGRENTMVRVVGLDILEGKTLFERSLASLGFTTQVIDHIEATERGPLLFFEGTAGLALLDARTGDERWALALPEGHRLSSYTLTKDRAYLHVFGPESATHGTLSKKLGSRLLVIDLATGKYVRSLPEGPLEPAPPPAKP